MSLPKSYLWNEIDWNLKSHYTEHWTFRIFSLSKTVKLFFAPFMSQGINGELYELKECLENIDAHTLTAGNI